jgi:hypothetical protein
MLYRCHRLLSPANLIAISTLSLSAATAHAQAETPTEIDSVTLDAWSAPYRGWHYWPEPVIPAESKVPGFEEFKNTDCPAVYRLPGQADLISKPLQSSTPSHIEIRLD